MHHRPWILAATATSALLPAALLHVVGTSPADVSADAHLGFVAVAAAVGGLASIALCIVAVRLDDARTVLLSTAFSTMTVLLLLHGLATPGVLVGANGVVALAGALSLPVGAGLLALSALPGLRRPRRVKPLVRMQIGLVALIGVVGIAGMLWPSLVPSVPRVKSVAAVVMLVLGVVFYLVLIHRSLRTFALTQRPADLLVAVGCAWLVVALFPQLLTGPGTIAFYAGHGVELLGIGLVAIPAVRDIRRIGAASRPLVGDLAPVELVVEEEQFLGSRVRALMMRLSEVDPYTELHSRRVAGLSARLAEAMGLPPAVQRQVAVGALLHDIGKLSVPAELLRKPEELDADEYAEVQCHVDRGVRLLDELGGFSDTVRRVVRQHHERLDGSGYPRGLGSCEIGMESRLVAICDVYDALASDRVHRPAWAPGDAVDFLRERAGPEDQFDPGIVAVLVDVLRADGVAIGPPPVPAPIVA